MTTADEDKEFMTVLARTLDVPPERLEPQLRLDTDLGLDSVAVVRVVMAVEEAMGLRFDDDEAAAATSVDELRVLVRRGRGGS